MDFRGTSVSHIANQVSAGELSAREVARAALDRIERLNPELGAFVTVDPEATLAEARLAIDERIAAGDDVGPLAGVPLGVKDLRTQPASSPPRVGGSPAAHRPRTTRRWERLRAAGAWWLARPTRPSWAEARHGQRAVRPHPQPVGAGALGRGSSGGSAAALAAAWSRWPPDPTAAAPSASLVGVRPVS
jgi:Asp-tRNA(Asn)/Glu-tRNA(Gln) amidotransferase A subunit family amidase